MSNLSQVGAYFVQAAPEGTMTPPKLQKLCVYAQSISLAYLGTPLFDEEMQAWDHGPIIPELYEEYGKTGILHADGKYDPDNFTSQQRLILATVQANFGPYTDWGLSEQSHLDFPGNFGSEEIIPKEEIRKAFWNNVLVKSLRATDAPVDTTNSKWITGKELQDVLEC